MPGLILNIRKPIGWTSFDIVRRIKNRIPLKVGHAGTLDPFASGVLLVCLGSATARVAELMDGKKEYTGRIALGLLTDTLDVSGKVIQTEMVPSFTHSDLEQIAKQFTGRLEQTAPCYSALKVSGTPMHKLARKGVQVEPKTRTVHIHEFIIAHQGANFIDFRVVVSKGTYVRSVARDFAEKLGTIGFLQKLTRTRIAEWTLRDAIEINTIEGAFLQSILEKLV
jgi:tRNA pseudouridine55 synthase